MGNGVEVISVLLSIGTAALEQAANIGCPLNLAGYSRSFDIIASQQSTLTLRTPNGQDDYSLKRLK
jgi:hypothetical protein